MLRTKLKSYFWECVQIGKGRTYLARVYNLPQGTCRTMIKMFREGWNSLDDADWLEFKNSFKK